MKTIGMIVPPAGDRVPPEALGLYPEGLRFVARSLVLRELTLEGYEAAIGRATELARLLREEDKADAIVLMGTSLSFFRGTEFNDRLVASMEQAAGVPVTTMSNAIRDALIDVGAKRVTVGTAYSEAVNAKLTQFLEASGFEVLHVEGMDLTNLADVQSVGADAVAELALSVDQKTGGAADAVLISCGGLPALELAASVEPRIGKPVVASATAGVWAGARLLGLDGASPSLGRLGMAGAR